MSTEETITLKLAGTDYQVRRLTLRQIKMLGIGNAKRRDQLAVLETTSNEQKEKDWYDAATSAVGAALTRDHADVAIDDLEATLAELTKAYLDVLQFSGLVPKGDPAPGEVAAAGQE